MHFSGAPEYSEESLPAEAKTEIAEAEHHAGLAQREVESDFNIVHSQSVITLWSALEDVVRTFVARWLMNTPGAKAQVPWADLRVKIGEYEGLDDEEKAHYLVNLAEQNLAAPLKQGINRFECLLDRLGLSGSISAGTRDAIFEMQQVRNVIAHRRGVADARFCRNCPDLQLVPGQRLMVSHKMWQKYFGGTHEYILELIFRTGEKCGDSAIRERSRRAVGAERDSLK